MNIHLKYKFLASIAVISLWVAFSFLFFYPNKNGMGELFSVSIIYMFTGWVALGAGLIMLALRALKIVKGSAGIIYITTGMLNLAIAVMATILYFNNKVDMSWFNRCLLNLLVGFLILTDILIFTSTKSKA